LSSFADLAFAGESPCVIDGETGDIARYGDVTAAVDRIRHALTGDRKTFGFILAENSLPTLGAYLAALRGKQAVCLLDAALDTTLLAKLITTYTPEWLWQPAALPIPEGYGAPTTVLTGYTLLFRTAAQRSTAIHEDLALLLTTSGSTGSPRLVRLSYANIQANALAIAASLELTPAERPITSLPLHYSYGLSVINSHLAVGAPIVLTNRTIISREFWSAVKDHQVTSIAGVPYTYQMLHRLRFANMDLPSLTALTQAGGRLDLTLQQYFAEAAAAKDIRFSLMYGQTEATARISCLPWQRMQEGIGSIGIPIPEGRIEVAPETGELIYYGPNVMMGYAECRDDLGRGDDCGGRLPTGDVGHRGENGLFYITGRLKRFIKPFGLRINLDDLERVIEARGGIVAPCTGDDTRLIVLAPDDADRDTIHDLLTNTIHLHHSAFRIIVDREIPRLANGKTDYQAIMARSAA